MSWQLLAVGQSIRIQSCLVSRDLQGGYTFDNSRTHEHKMPRNVTDLFLTIYSLPANNHNPLNMDERSKMKQNKRKQWQYWVWYFESTYADYKPGEILSIEGILPKGPYLPCASMAGRALLAGYPCYEETSTSLRKYYLLEKIGWKSTRHNMITV